MVLARTLASDLGLLSGIGGQILVCSELSLQNQTSQNWLSHLHNILSERLSNEHFIFTHCGGLAGIGWLYEYLSQRKIIDYDTNEILEDFDTCLETALRNFFQIDNYDFLHGGVGVALYFIKRIEKKKELLPVLVQFLEDLEKISTKQEDGSIKWLSFLGKEHNPQQGYNISLSHGMASIVSILSKLYKVEGLDKEKIETLLRGTVQYILAQEIEKDKYGCFFPNFALESLPSKQVDEDTSEQVDKNTRQLVHSSTIKSRLGWCYGDLGIASALYQAGIALKENTWIDKALEVLTFAAIRRRNLQDNLVVDAGLCHGAAGIGHIFYRMWWNTKLPEFKDAADYWFEETLKMAYHKDGLAGFKSLEMPDGKPAWINKYGLLEGISGIGLAMLTYYYEMEPAWDECLLLS